MKVWVVSDLHFERVRPEEVTVLEKPDDADVGILLDEIGEAITRKYREREI